MDQTTQETQPSRTSVKAPTATPTVEVEGWSLAVRDGEPLVSDEEIARHIELDARVVRQLIRRNRDAGNIRPAASFSRTVTNPRGGRPGEAFLLTENDALFIVTRSDAPRAIEMTKVMIRVFLTVRDRLAGKVVVDHGLSTLAQTLQLLAEQNAAIVRQNSEALQILMRRVEAIEARPGPQSLQIDRIDDVETRVGRVEADVASGVIGPEVAEREILVPLRLLSADPTTPGKLNVSRRMSYDKRLRNEVEFNGEDTRWEKLERVKLARAQRFIGRLMREADEGRRKAIRDAQTKAREAREKGKNQQTEIKSVIEFDPTRRRKRKPKLGA